MGNKPSSASSSSSGAKPGGVYGGGQPIPSSGVASAPASQPEGGAVGAGATPSRSMPARKACLDDFVLLKTVGRGSFGKVIMVRKKSDDRVYAMKALKKEQVLKRRQYEHTLSERRILENIDHPFIVSLRFAFQTEHK